MTSAVLGASALFGTVAAMAQRPLDRTDPSVIEEDLRRPEKQVPDAKPPVMVETPREAVADAVGAITVGAIRVDGAEMLPQAAFAPVIERYAGRRLSEGELQALAGEIAGVARAAGFGLATAGIPQQTVSNGILRVLLDEGRIDAVRAEGDAADIVNRLLAPLADGRPVATARLERQLSLAGDLPGLRLGQARIDHREGRNILRLRAERRRTEGWFSLDNWGTRSNGPLRLQLSGDINGLLADDDQLRVGAVVTAPQPQEFGLIRAEYSKHLGRNGTELSAYGYLARSRPGRTFGDFGGDSREGTIALSHQFRRTRASRLRGEAGFTVREAKQDLRGVRIREDRLTIITAAATSFGKLSEGRGQLRLAVVQGLDLFGATERGDPLASRLDADGAFTKLSAWAHYDQPLGRRFSFQARAEGQVANRPLLVSEEMGLGGRYFLRGHEYRELSGDEGVAGSIELRHDLKPPQGLIKAGQPYVYADVGTVSNKSGGLGGGSLATAGGGLRLWIGKIEAALELGVPLGGHRLADRDPRLSFTLATRF